MEGVRCYIPKKTEIYCSNNASVESLVSQLQPYCDKILTVVNGSTIRIFENLDAIPPGHRILENSTPLMIGRPREFYLRDLDRDERICCFSEEVKDKFIQPSIGGPKEEIPKIKLPQISAKEIPGREMKESRLDSNSAPLMSRFDNFQNKSAKGGEKRKTKVRSLETTLSRDPNIKLPYLDGSNRPIQLDWVNGSNRPTNNLKISDDVIDITVPLVPAPAFSRNEKI
jgi:hypothetical protein